MQCSNAKCKKNYLLKGELECTVAEQLFLSNSLGKPQKKVLFFSEQSSKKGGG